MVIRNQSIRSENVPPPASDYLGGHQKQKFSLHFPIWRAEEFLLNGKENFVSGVLPSRIQAVGGARFGLGKVKTIFGDLDFTFPRLISDLGILSARRRGLGRNAGGLFLENLGKASII